MGFYIRKSLKLGPIRLNFSKSGVGLSAGVTGARFAVNARGKKYIHLGRSTLPEDLQAAGDAESSGAGISWGVVLAYCRCSFRVIQRPGKLNRATAGDSPLTRQSFWILAGF
ncbi:MAG: DUF4236 domain-containing protein [Deltaproteobacteria bacterium]|nr:DUF4236 domain-containing protein [Deltaproteobacteria bacterium]